jgi:ATP synthase protein I
MTDDDPDARRLAIGNALKRRAARGKVRQKTPPRQIGAAFRLVTELLAAVIVGVNWLGARSVFGTSPLLLIVMFMLGVAAGMRNVIRTAREMNESQDRSSG